MKKCLILVCIALICILLCSCRVYVHEEDVGRYYLYENGEKTNTWIEFKRNKTGWKDSDGNSGHLNNGNDDGQIVLYGPMDKKTGEYVSVYIGYLDRGTFFFRKPEDVKDGVYFCRNYYSDKSKEENKDSGYCALRKVVYSTTLPGNVSIRDVYALIRNCYAFKGYRPFDINGREEYKTENNVLIMTYWVKDCDETKELDSLILNNTPETSFLIKNGEKIVLTANDFVKMIDTYALYQIYPPKLKFYENSSVSEKLEALYDKDPSAVLKLYVFDEYVCDVSVSRRGNVYQTDAFEVGGTDVGLLAKDVLLTQMGIRMQLQDDD